MYRCLVPQDHIGEESEVDATWRKFAHWLFGTVQSHDAIHLHHVLHSAFHALRMQPFTHYPDPTWIWVMGEWCIHASGVCLFNVLFSGGPGLAGTRMSPLWSLLELRVMEVAVTNGAIRRAKFQ